MLMTVSPAVPLLAGPGTITTAMNFAAARSVQHTVITIGCFGILCSISYLFFVSGEKLIRYIGENAVNAVTRLMGLILAVIGTQMLIQGVHGAIQSFK